MLLAVVILFNALLAGCGGKPDGTPGNSAQAAASETSPHPDSVQIRIDNFTFEPAEVTIPAGTKVTWVNHDDVPHTATSSAKPRQFDSGTLDTDDQFSYV